MSNTVSKTDAEVELTSRVDLRELPICDDLIDAVEFRGWTPGGEAGLFGGFEAGP